MLCLHLNNDEFANAIMDQPQQSPRLHEALRRTSDVSLPPHRPSSPSLSMLVGQLSSQSAMARPTSSLSSSSSSSSSTAEESDAISSGVRNSSRTEGFSVRPVTIEGDSADNPLSQTERCRRRVSHKEKEKRKAERNPRSTEKEEKKQKKQKKREKKERKKEKKEKKKEEKERNRIGNRAGTRGSDTEVEQPEEFDTPLQFAATANDGLDRSDEALVRWKLPLFDCSPAASFGMPQHLPLHVVAENWYVWSGL